MQLPDPFIVLAFLQDATIDYVKIIYALGTVITTLAGVIVWLFNVYSKTMKDNAEKTAVAITKTTHCIEQSVEWMKAVDGGLKSNHDLLMARSCSDMLQTLIARTENL